MAELFEDNRTVEGRQIAYDVVNGVMYPRVKVAFGVDGSVSDASTSNPLPVSLAAGSILPGWAKATNGDIIYPNAGGITTITEDANGNPITISFVDPISGYTYRQTNTFGTGTKTLGNWVKQ